MRKTGNRQYKLEFSLAALLVLASMLVACSDNGEQTSAELGNQSSAIDDEAAAKYQEKVKKRVSASVVSSFAREWDVPEPKVECLLVDLNVMQLEDAATDVKVAAVFKRCGVDPAVAE